jgi:hypothetical protein
VPAARAATAPKQVVSRKVRIGTPPVDFVTSDTRSTPEILKGRRRIDNCIPASSLSQLKTPPHSMRFFITKVNHGSAEIETATQLLERALFLQAKWVPAGAHLSAPVALAGGEPAYSTEYRDVANSSISHTVKALVGFYGVYDMLGQWEHDQDRPAPRPDHREIPRRVRHEVVTHVLGTTRHLCVRAGQPTAWLGRQDSNLCISESEFATLSLGRGIRTCASGNQIRCTRSSESRSAHACRTARCEKAILRPPQSSAPSSRADGRDPSCWPISLEPQGR